MRSSTITTAIRSSLDRATALTFEPDGKALLGGTVRGAIPRFEIVR